MSSLAGQGALGLEQRVLGGSSETWVHLNQSYLLLGGHRSSARPLPLFWGLPALLGPLELHSKGTSETRSANTSLYQQQSQAAEAAMTGPDRGAGPRPGPGGHAGLGAQLHPGGERTPPAPGLSPPQLLLQKACPRLEGFETTCQPGVKEPI